MAELSVGIMGAGAIGCFVGGALQARAGVDVVLVGRQRVGDELAASGLELEDLDGSRAHVAADRIRFAADPAALAGCDVVLVCVKSGQTSDTAAILAGLLRPGTVVVSLQNGVRNGELLRDGMPAQRVLPGIVGFNVVGRGAGVYRRATSGPLVIEDAPDPRVARLAGALRTAGFTVELPRDIRPMQWTKLIMNLNNAVSALTDAPTQQLIFARPYRRILAALMGEAIAVLRRAGIRPARLGAPLPVHLFPMVLRLPTPLLRVVARSQIKIDPQARSSMWEDLTRGRRTEVDQLNGEIVRLAESCGADAPLNRRVVELVHRAEQRGPGSPALPADTLWRQLRGRG